MQVSRATRAADTKKSPRTPCDTRVWLRAPRARLESAASAAGAIAVLLALGCCVASIAACEGASTEDAHPAEGIPGGGPVGAGNAATNPNPNSPGVPQGGGNTGTPGNGQGGTNVGTGFGTSGGVPGSSAADTTGPGTNIGTGFGVGGGVSGAAALGGDGTGVPQPTTPINPGGTTIIIDTTSPRVDGGPL